MSLLEELRRRNVFRVAAAYLVVGWLLTEVLTTILPTLGAPDWAARAVILIFAFGFIPAIALSWFFEWTHDGVKRESELDRDVSDVRRSGKALDFITIGGVLAAIIMFAFFAATRGIDAPVPAGHEAKPTSVAVLPFVNMSNDVDNEYFSDGLTETLLHMLTQVPDLKVAARTSSFSFKGQTATIGEIAAALGVAYVLEGSVQRDGDRVRVTAQLIRAEDEFHVWSEVYNRTLDDIFAIQDEIAERVGAALSATLLPSPAGGREGSITTADADAYDLYLQALSQRATFSYGGLRAAEDLLKGALTVDPNFLDAKMELAYNYMAQAETGLMTYTKAVQEIQAQADQVLAMKPGNIRAQAIRLYADTMLDTQEGNFQALFDTIASLEPMVAAAPTDLEVRSLLVRLLQGTQQLDRALELMQAALDLDPINARIHYELGSLNAAIGDSERARVELSASLKIEPRQPNAYAILAGLDLRAGDGVEFVRQILHAIEADPKDHELPGMIAGFLYELELVEEADDFRDRVLAIAPTSEIAHRIELQRAIAIEDEAAGVAAARRAIEANIDNRRFGFAGAVQYLLRVALRRGTVAEEFDYLEQHAPGILDVGSDSVSPKYRAAQMTAFDAWYAVLSAEELEAQIQEMLEITRKFGFDPADNPMMQFALLALRGETEQAIEVALDDVLVAPVAANLGWERTIAQKQYASMAADPRVQVAIERWEIEEAQLRSDVRAFLVDLQVTG